jgi:putative hydrolase of the HAD superfamily
MTTVMFDSDQGEKTYRDCTPDYTITDFRDLLQILGLPLS